MTTPQTIFDLKSLAQKTIIIRAGLNVPTSDRGVILDDFRIKSFLPTLQYLVDQKSRVIVIAHIGREKHESLSAVAKYISQYVPINFKEGFFSDDAFGKSAQLSDLKDEINASPGGSVFLLDNIRQSGLEKANDQHLAEAIASLGEVYINEAFSVSHREHASLVGVPQYVQERATGIVCSEEIEQLTLARNANKNAIGIIGGNKFATKLPLISQLLNQYSTVVIAGALANTLYYVAGYEIGYSVYEQELDQEMHASLEQVIAHPQAYIPSIVIVKNQVGNRETKHISEVQETDTIYDIAPEGLFELEESVVGADYIVWNGPLGYYEGGYTEGTNHLLNVIASNNNATSVVGGGNTVDAVRDAGREKDISFLSTGGGAMIEFLTTGTLPALEKLS